MAPNICIFVAWLHVLSSPFTNSIRIGWLWVFVCTTRSWYIGTFVKCQSLWRCILNRAVSLQLCLISFVFQNKIKSVKIAHKKSLNNGIDLSFERHSLLFFTIFPIYSTTSFYIVDAYEWKPQTKTICLSEYVGNTAVNIWSERQSFFSITLVFTPDFEGYIILIKLVCGLDSGDQFL